MKSVFFALAATALLAGCASGNSAYNTTASAPQAQVAKPGYGVDSLKPASARTTARGTFVGENDHITTGGADVFKHNGTWFVRLGPDFSLDGAPDPKVALGNKARGGYQPGTILGKLANLNGEQVYALTPGLNIGDYDQVYIWCEKFSVSLGHADLTLI